MRGRRMTVGRKERTMMVDGIFTGVEMASLKDKRGSKVQSDVVWFNEYSERAPDVGGRFEYRAT
jgi:hypothetical protein